jgi:hypothetical protein
MTATDFTNLATHGRRLNRIVKRLEKRFHKENDLDKQIKIANSIGFVTREIISISKLHLGIGELLENKAVR